MADHLVEDACGPSTVRDVRPAFVVSGALDLTDDDTVFPECFAVHTQTTSGEALTRAAQHDAGRRLHGAQAVVRTVAVDPAQRLRRSGFTHEVTLHRKVTSLPRRCAQPPTRRVTPPSTRIVEPVV